MLVEFSVTNYKSIAEKQTFSMAAGPGKGKLKPYAFMTGNSFAPKLMNVACIFGPNGVGKSSFIDALSFFEGFIISSAKDSQEGELINIKLFVLDKEFKDKPSEFEIVFIHEENLYQYGFSVNQLQIVDEWMFMKPNKPRTTQKEIFQRNYNPDTNEYTWSFDHLKGRKEVWKEATRDNALFLATAVMLRSEMLKQPFTWLRQYLRVIKNTERLDESFTISQIQEHDRKEKILNILKLVDLGIADLSVQTIGKVQPDTLPEFIRNYEAENGKRNSYHFKESSSDAELIKIDAIHTGRSGEPVNIDLDNQSDGTKVIFNIAGPLIDVFEKGYSLFVDELHNSLHPHALRLIVEMFLNPEVNKKNAQLIFTSHETSIMARNFLHRDQIWLMEKEEGATRLFPLSDFNVREYEAFQKSYLDGRFGAVPRIGDFVDG